MRCNHHSVMNLDEAAISKASDDDSRQHHADGERGKRSGTCRRQIKPLVGVLNQVTEACHHVINQRKEQPDQHDLADDVAPDDGAKGLKPASDFRTHLQRASRNSIATNSATPVTRCTIEATPGIGKR